MKKTIQLCLAIIAVLTLVSCGKQSENTAETTTEQESQESIEETDKKKSNNDTNTVSEQDSTYSPIDYDTPIECIEDEDGEIICYYLIGGSKKPIETQAMDEEPEGENLILKYAPKNGYESIVEWGTIHAEAPSYSYVSDDRFIQYTDQTHFHSIRNGHFSSPDGSGSHSFNLTTFPDKSGICISTVCGETMTSEDPPQGASHYGKLYRDSLNNWGIDSDGQIVEYQGKPAIYVKYSDAQSHGEIWFNIQPFYALKRITHSDEGILTITTTGVIINKSLSESEFEKQADEFHSEETEESTSEEDN